jgi:hypothetical protein
MLSNYQLPLTFPAGLQEKSSIDSCGWLGFQQRNWPLAAVVEIGDTRGVYPLCVALRHLG